MYTCVINLIHVDTKIQLNSKK